MGPLLEQRKLWGMTVDTTCNLGNPWFYAKSPAGDMWGSWQGYCGRNDATLTVISTAYGLNKPCESDADCADINCPTTCALSDNGSPVCTSNAPACWNVTTAMIDPQNFKQACPPDPRDTTCLAKMMAWPGTCSAFDLLLVSPYLPLPDVGIGVFETCLQIIMGYHSCLFTQFSASDKEYMEARKVSPVLVQRMNEAVTPATTEPPVTTTRQDTSSSSSTSTPPSSSSSTSTLSTAPQCIDIPMDMFVQHDAVPCDHVPAL